VRVAVAFPLFEVLRDVRMRERDDGHPAEVVSQPGVGNALIF
jgi:hypothetical protein